MGMRPTAKLGYGFIIESEDQDDLPRLPFGGDNDDQYDWESFAETLPGYPAKPADENYRSAKWDRWRENKSAFLEGIGVTVELVGAEQCLESYVFALESFREVDWEAKKIDDWSLDNREKWNALLEQWCKIVGIPPQKPSLVLASLYF